MSGPLPETQLLTPLEIASGMVVGADGHDRRLPPGGPDGGPRATFEQAIVTALRRPPCLVSFSGGRDSSAVLAVAAHVARREGLGLPVPVTSRFPDAPDSGEDEWQELVVAHLDLGEWIRIEFRDELDAVGPVAAAVLRRHGLLWPPNIHMHVPLLDAAAGGSLLTGLGGDEVLSVGRWSRIAQVLARRVRPVPRDILRIGLAYGPASVRRALLRRRLPAIVPWLRSEARREVESGLVAHAAAEPVAWPARFLWLSRMRYLQVAIAGLRILGRSADVEVGHPFLEPPVLAAFARLPRAQRFVGRAAGMGALFGDVLPESILTRTAKARFGAPLWGEHSRALVARWRGEGVDPRLVDLDRLRRTWSGDPPDSRSLTQLQRVWLELED